MPNPWFEHFENRKQAFHLPSLWNCFQVSPSAFAKWSSTDMSFDSLCSVIITCFWGAAVDTAIGACCCCGGIGSELSGDGVVGGVAIAWLCCAANIAWWCWWIWCFLWCFSLSMLCCCWAWSATAACCCCCWRITCSSSIRCFCIAICSCSNLLRIMRS